MPDRVEIERRLLNEWRREAKAIEFLKDLRAVLAPAGGHGVAIATYRNGQTGVSLFALDWGEYPRHQWTRFLHHFGAAAVDDLGMVLLLTDRPWGVGWRLLDEIENETGAGWLVGRAPRIRAGIDGNSDGAGFELDLDYIECALDTNQPEPQPRLTRVAGNRPLRVHGRPGKVYLPARLGSGERWILAAHLGAVQREALRMLRRNRDDMMANYLHHYAKEGLLALHNLYPFRHGEEELLLPYLARKLGPLAARVEGRKPTTLERDMEARMDRLMGGMGRWADWLIPEPLRQRAEAARTAESARKARGRSRR